MADVFEFRGVDNLVYAEVTGDDNEVGGGYVTGTVKKLSAVATVAKSTDSSSEAHYYDNQAMNVVNSEAADQIVLTIAPPDLATQADLTGKDYDTATGMLIDSERTPKYFAIGYRTKGTDGHYRYVWRLKGSFAIPDETNETENDGTDTTNMELTFTGIYTAHKFQKNNKTSKGIVVDERSGNADLSEFFDSVQTPDTITAACVVTFSKTPTTATIVVKNSDNETVMPAANGTYKLGEGSYTYTATASGYTPITDTTLAIAASDVATGTKTVTVTMTEI